MEKYLKSHQFYSDLYDHHTIDECRRLEQIGMEVEIPDYKGKVIQQEEKDRMRRSFNKLHLYFVSGERYKNKSIVINEWMRRDEDRDRLYETAEAPKGIHCLTCSREMFVSYKHLETYLDKPDRVLFMYDCTIGHLPRRAFFNNGEEWKHDKPVCVKCNGPIESIDEDTDKVWKSISTCTKCGHVEISEIKKSVKDEPNPNFEKDRARFCSDEEGEKYVQWMSTLKELDAVLKKDQDKKDNKELYDRVDKLKKLSIPQVKELLVQSFEKESYKNLIFEKPSIERIVSMEFSIEDPTDQIEYDSRTKLAKIIKKILKDTNWRLMSEGISCRLGLLSGRIRAYEKEEELLKLV